MPTDGSIDDNKVIRNVADDTIRWRQTCRPLTEGKLVAARKALASTKRWGCARR